MKSYNHKCIKVCSSMKVSLLYLCVDYHSLSLTDDVYSLFHLVCSPTRSSVSHCQPFSIPMLIILLYNGFNINNYYIHYYKNVFAHKCYYYTYATSSFHVPSIQMRMRN